MARIIGIRLEFGGEIVMEDMNFPIILKKRNGFMIFVSIVEILTGVVWGMLEGIKSAPLWVLVFVGIITALSVWGEYSQDIFIKENKIEFYKNKDLIKAIKYNCIKSISIGKGEEQKNKKKDFLTIKYNENDTKKSKNGIYLINPMNYSANDLAKIRDVIVTKNSSVKIEEDVNKFIK